MPATEAEGPGPRFALWFQGCPLRCPGCCNPEMLPFEGGQATPLSEVLRQLDAADGVEGITLLGGEPTAHAAGAAALAGGPRAGAERHGLLGLHGRGTGRPARRGHRRLARGTPTSSWTAPMTGKGRTTSDAGSAARTSASTS
ncbi:MAG: 4Fe-4S cluster-binding domain-containing protein [Gemmataceae bacterium]